MTHEQAASTANRPLVTDGQDLVHWVVGPLMGESGTVQRLCEGNTRTERGGLRCERSGAAQDGTRHADLGRALARLLAYYYTIAGTIIHQHLSLSLSITYTRCVIVWQRSALGKGCGDELARIFLILYMALRGLGKGLVDFSPALFFVTSSGTTRLPKG